MADLFGAAEVTEALTQPRHLWQPPTVETLQSLLPEYHILSYVARGGMGAVYKAVQRSLHRTVAIKVLPPEGSVDQELNYAERFKQEARAMAKLRHPAIVTVHEAGEVEGLLYIVMEFVEGVDVAQMVAAQGKLPQDLALSITVQVCEALAYAHGNGVVHRDIKPSNVMLSKTGRVKVADFGLAKFTSHQGSSLTRSDMRMGTPDFTAPESYIPFLEVDQRADIYAMGVMLYQMLTGKIPRGAFETASLLVQEVDPRFDAIIDKAMRVDREKRYSTALELHEALDALSTKARPSPVSLKRPKKKALFAFIALACASLGGAVFFQSKRLPPPEKTSQTTIVNTVVEPPAPLPAAAPVVTNSLGMKFVEVHGTKALFCIHETRRRDYAAYAAENSGVNPLWQTQLHLGVPSGDGNDHPVVGVSWQDAQAFCAWLSKTENRTYRLPTDQEWSAAVGIGIYEKSSRGPMPTSNKKPLDTAYPYGKDFPPKTGDRSGNYADTASREKFPEARALPDYSDGFATTAPVMSFQPDRLGLFDMGGNVWEWCQDWNGLPNVSRILRGGAFDDSDRQSLLSSRRRAAAPDAASPIFGFRCVLITTTLGEAVTAPAPAPPPAIRDSTSNSLGMKFVPVPGSNLLFCIHETRRQDYAAYARQVPGVIPEWQNQRRQDIPCGDKDDHPVCGVNRDDARNFCAWLSQKEGVTYRLPTDAEWSLAAGIEESNPEPKMTPNLLSPHCPPQVVEAWEQRHGTSRQQRLLPKLETTFPYGGSFPPKTEQLAGNYADMIWKAAFPTHYFLEGYSDGFPTTAPVMSFQPNPLGLYDMGGNLWEWVDEWYDDRQKERVLRGGSFFDSHSCYLLSNFRHHNRPEARTDLNGFRVVMVKPENNSAPASK